MTVSLTLGILPQVVSDGIGVKTNLEWSEELLKEHQPRICAFGHGLLIYGPDHYLRVSFYICV